MDVIEPVNDKLERKVISRIPTSLGRFKLYLYKSSDDDKEHIALVMGEVQEKEDVLVRIHSECLTGEVFGSRRCDCREQLCMAMEKISEEGVGVLIYLRQEGRGIGLLEKLRAYNLQDQGYDTVDANLLLGHRVDERDYANAARILHDLRIHSVRLLTNNPHKIESLSNLGIAIKERIPILSTVNDDNARYLLTKALRMNHFLQKSLISESGLKHEDSQAANCRRSNDLTPDSCNINTRDLAQNIDYKSIEDYFIDKKLDKYALFNKLSLYFTGPRQVLTREEELPAIGDNQVLVETLFSAISPGTESLIYRGEFPEEISVDGNIASLAGNFSYPLKYGYSAVGQIVDVGDDVDSRWKGRLVAAFNPHESHFIAEPGTLIPLPDDIEPEDGVFLPNMETAINFVMDGSPLIGENVAVFGQGIVGLLTTSLLARFPLANLITLDRFPMRRKVSREVGARVCLDPDDTNLQKKLTECLPNGADLTYEISGSPIALDQALNATGFAGRIVIGSWYGSKRSSLSLGGKFHRSRISLISSQVSTVAPEFQGRWTKTRRFEIAWEMIRQLKPSRFITHRFHIQDAAKAYRLLDQMPEKAIQILLIYP